MFWAFVEGDFQRQTIAPASTKERKFPTPIGCAFYFMDLGAR